ncbi:MAG: hypothetical protein GY757_22165, partial [bacterium]|nr:hypothetical protein [bacterium]
VLKEHLLQVLPDYMIPPFFVKVDKIPLTANGKVNKRLLPAIIAGAEEEYVPPGSPTEESLVEIWSEVLGVGGDKIGVFTDFFSIGGHSLNATSITNQVHETFDVRIPLTVVLQTPTVRELALYIDNAAMDKYKPIAAVEKKEYYDLSYAQGRMWTMNQVGEASSSLNVPIANILEGTFNRDLFTRAFYTLVERHDSLRTVFLTVPPEGDVKQKILPSIEIDYQPKYIDLRLLQRDNRESEAKKLLMRESGTAFNLLEGPLFRIRVIQLEEETIVLLLILHHIIGDFLSIEVLAKELFALYDAYGKDENNPLTPLGIQYKDYVNWMEKQFEHRELEKHETFWLNRFKGGAPTLELPLDKKRPSVQTYNGHSAGLTINDGRLNKLRRFGEEGTTLFMKLMALFKIVLYQYSGQTDIVVGIPIAGREHGDLKNQIGFFINSLALRTQFSGKDSFTEVLNKVKHTAMNAFEHQAYPFDKLVDKLGYTRDISRHPLFDVAMDMLNYNILENLDTGTNLKMRPFDSGYTKSKFDITIFVQEGQKNVVMDFVYNTDLFQHSTILRLVERYRTLLDKAIEHPTKPISRLVWDEHLQLSPIEPQTPATGITKRQPLSYHQERMWFIDTFERGNLYDSSPVYHNVPLILTLKGELDIETLEQSIREVIARHQSLHTGIEAKEGEELPHQLIDPGMKFKLEESGSGGAPLARALEEAKRPFLIEKEPLIRARLIRFEERNFLLVITVHHMVADNYSRQILARELLITY